MVRAEAHGGALLLRMPPDVWSAEDAGLQSEWSCVEERRLSQTPLMSACPPDSGGRADIAGARVRAMADIGGSYSLRQRLCGFACGLDEKPSSRTERSVLQSPGGKKPQLGKGAPCPRMSHSAPSPGGTHILPRMFGLRGATRGQNRGRFCSTLRFLCCRRCRKCRKGVRPPASRASCTSCTPSGRRPPDRTA